MESIDKLFKSYSNEHRLGEDFEDKVYTKIKKKKVYKKMTYSFSFVIFLFFIFFAYHFFTVNSKNIRNLKTKSEKFATKEEIPLIEDVYFASYDNETNYVIEKVSLNKYDNDI